MSDVAMPRLSDSMEEGTILKWLKSDGDEVKRGEELVEIETDKANMTYEADQDGVLKIVAQEGDTLPVGETIASIGEGAAAGGGAQPAAEEQQPAAEEQPAEEQAPPAEQPAQPAAEQPAAEQPAAEQPAQQPAAEQPAAEQPAQQPAAEQPAAEQPAQQPAAEQPAAEQPAAEQPAAEQPAAEQPAEPAAEPAPAEPAPAAEEDAGGDADGNGRIKASPVARRMAREMGLELARLEGSGPGGRIVKADVEAAAHGSGPQAEAPAAAVEAPPREPEPAAPAAEPAPAEERRETPAPVVSGEGQTGKGEVTVEDLSRLQQTIARRMAESKATAPEFVLNIDVDMEDAVSLRKQLKAAAGDQPAPSFNDFVIKAAALALRDFPRANGAYRDGKFELYSRVNVGIAVAGQDALVVPTVFDADQKSLGQIARDARALAERVRAGAITPPELSSGTFTVSNLGMFGIDSFVAVINPPQAAILAVGAMRPTAVVRDGEVAARSMMRLTLACDHRILYGADAAQFLSRIRERLEQPLLLVL